MQNANWTADEFMLDRNFLGHVPLECCGTNSMLIANLKGHNPYLSQY
jgi:hypothetical protein